MLCCLSACLVAAAQAEMDKFVRHYSGYYLSEGSAGKAQLQRVDKTVKYHLKRSWRNYYNIIIENDGGARYLTLTGDRELVFADDNSTANSDFLIEQGEGGYSLLKCRGNGKYVGTDDARLGSAVYCDKDGKSSKHLWYVAEVSQAHRHWQLIPLQLSADPASVDAVTQATVKLATGRNMLTVTAPSESRCNVAVYALNGVCKGNVDFTESVAVPLASGYYVVRVSCDGSVTTRTVKVQ